MAVVPDVVPALFVEMAVAPDVVALVVEPGCPTSNDDSVGSESHDGASGPRKKRRLNSKTKGCESCGGPCPPEHCTEAASSSAEQNAPQVCCIQDLNQEGDDAANAFANAVRAHRDRASAAAPSVASGSAAAAAEPIKFVSNSRRWSSLRSGPGRAPMGFGHVPAWLKESPVIGKVKLHSTHSLGWHRGLIWCWTCGLYSTTVPIGLKSKCDGETLSGTKNLSRLRKGLPP